MNECKTVRDLLALRADEWSVIERRLVETHLDACSDCANLAHVYARQDHLLRATPSVRLTPSQRDQFLSKIHRERRRHEMNTKVVAVFGTAIAAVILVALVVGLSFMFRGEGQTTDDVPADTASASAEISTPGLESDVPLPSIHIVQDGETLSDVASHYDVSVEKLLAVNSLERPSTLQPEKILIVPTGKGEVPPSTFKGQFQWPTKGRDISGWTFDDPREPGHPSLDIATQMQEPIVAAADGRVIFAGWGEDYGFLVIVEHADDWLSVYSHLDEITVQVEQQVLQGELLGKAGTSGAVTGPHLHFELRYQGYPVNPLSYLPHPFAIYLVDDELELADDPVLSLDDIETYTWETHEVTLTDAAYARFAALEVSVGSGLPFAVTVDGEPVYYGAFWSLASSAIYDGVVINVPPSTPKQPIQIQLGYPGADFFKGQDPRDDPAIFEALTEAGKISALLNLRP